MNDFIIKIVSKTNIRLIFILFIFSKFIGTNISQQLSSFNYEKIKQAQFSEGVLTVQAIYEDSRGFLWIGLLSGLVKYDGYKFTEYTNNIKDPYSISDNKINSILEDNNGNLWVGTQNGINYLDVKQDKFFHYTDTTKSGIGAINFGKLELNAHGELCLGCLGGYYELNTTTQYFHRKRLNHFPPDLYVSSFKFIGKGLIIGTLKGLYYQRTLNDTVEYIKTNFIENDTVEVYTLYVENNSKVWVGTTKGLYLVSTTNEELKHKVSDSYLPSDEINSIYKKSDDELWLGSNNGLIILNTKTKIIKRLLTDSSDAEYIQNKFVGILGNTKNNILWLGANNLLKADIKKNQFQNIKLPQSLFDNSVPELFEIYEYDTNQLFIPYENGPGLLNIHTGQITPFQYKPSYNLQSWKHGIICFYEEKNGLLWLGNWGGIYLFNKHTNKFIDIEKDVPGIKDLLNTAVRKIHKDRKGNVWIATWTSGIFKLNMETKSIKHYYWASFAMNTRTILEDRSGNIWFGTRGGNLKYLEPQDSFKLYQNDPKDTSSISENTSFSLYEDPDGYIWCGTYGGGLNRFDPKTEKFKHYTKNDGLVDNNITSIYPDKNGDLWLSTFRGLSHFNIKEESFTTYNKESGLLNIGHPSFMHGQGKKSNLLYFAGEVGIDYFHPDSIKVSTFNPPVYITGFKLFNKEVPISRGKKDKVFRLKEDISFAKNLNLTYDQNVITFDYVALDYSAPENIQYAYQLVGFDTAWQYINKQRSATFTNLNPGQYTFNVKATNADGVWSNKMAVLQISISPPWWKTWWAYSLYLISFIGSIGSYIQYRSRSLKLRNVQLEQKVESRTAELNQSLVDLKTTQNQLIQSEKMASLGELTSGIAHEIKNPLNFINNFSEINVGLISELEKEQAPALNESQKTTIAPIMDYLKINSQRIKEHGKRVDSIVKGMLQHSRVGSSTRENINMNTLCEEAVKLAYHGFKAKQKTFNATYELHLDPNLPEYHGVKQDISRVILNIVNNAFYACTEFGRKEIEVGKLENSGLSRIPTSISYLPLVSISTKNQGNRIEVRVSDNGSGISSIIINKIFQPFFTTKPTGEGTGLGLSLAYDIITKGHGGTLSVKSEEGKGSEFEIVLPV